MSILDLESIRKSSEPKPPELYGFIDIASVGDRPAPEILLLELFRAVFFEPPGTSRHIGTRNLTPYLVDDSNQEIYSPAEQAVICAMSGRAKAQGPNTKQLYYAPAYPGLARHAWLRKQAERLVPKLLYEGAFAQHLWASTQQDIAEEKQRDSVDQMLSAFMGTARNETGTQQKIDILAATLGNPSETVDDKSARATLLSLTKNNGVLEDITDKLASRIFIDFMSICGLENRIPRLLWLRLTMTFLRFSLPMWYLAQMRLTTLLHKWLVDAIENRGCLDTAAIKDAISKKHRNLLRPTLTPTNSIDEQIVEYVKCRVELRILLHCLCQINPSLLQGKTISITKVGAEVITLADLLLKAREAGPILRAQEEYDSAPSVRVFISRCSEKYDLYRDPLHKGQGKNIREFLRVLQKGDSGDATGGHLLLKQGKRKQLAYRVFPGQLLLQTIAYLSASAKQNEEGTGGGKLVLRDIEDHFKEYGIDFAVSADARPLLMEQLQVLGLLSGSPDAGSSVAVTCPFPLT